MFLKRSKERQSRQQKHSKLRYKGMKESQSDLFNIQDASKLICMITVTLSLRDQSAMYPLLLENDRIRIWDRDDVRPGERRTMSNILRQ